MKPDRDEKLDRLVSLAGSVSDGGEVDWEKVARTAGDPDERELIEQLRAVARIAAVHQPGDEDGQAGGPAGERGPERWGHLELLERVGGGAFAEVYRARDPKLDCEVALKLLRQHESSRAGLATQIIEEGRLLARVRHPNVARVFGAERHEGRVGMWMEFIRGRDLEEFLEEHGRLGADEAIVIGRDLCRALAAVHRAGVVHRDVKTRNVMREEGGRIVLADFGAGREAGTARGGEESGEMSGTPLYMAPELFRGGKATAQSDIYSLGVVLYHLVTGAYPVQGQTVDEVKQAHDSGRRALLRDMRPDVPEAFARVVEKAIDPDPEARFSSAGQLEQALAQALGVPWSGDEESRRREGGARGAATRLRRRRRALVLAVAIPVAVAAAGLGIAAWRQRGTFEVEAALHRLAGGAEQTLLPGATISTGDELLLELAGSRPLHAYVVSQDEAGETFLLFPLRDSDLKNPLPGGRKHRIPGTQDGIPLVWTVTSAGGREHILIAASLDRLVELEADMLALETPQGSPEAAPSPSPYPRLNENAIFRLRGIGGLEKRPLASAQGGAGTADIFNSVKQLASRAERARGIWVRQIDLEYAKAP